MKCLFGIIFLISVNASAQINVGPRFSGMASTGVSLSDVWSVHENQAGIAAVMRASFAVAFQKPFAGYDLSTQAAAMILPVSNNVFALSIQQYGNGTYKHQKTGLSYARSFGDQLFAAITFNHHMLRIDGYGSSQTYSVEAGAQYKVGRSISLGVHVATPGIRGSDRDLDLPVETRVQLGASCRISEKLILAMSVDKAFHKHTDVRTGLEYRAIEMLALRGGLSANPFRQFAGLGVNYKKLNMDISVSSQPIVGYSPQISLSYEL